MRLLLSTRPIPGKYDGAAQRLSATKKSYRSVMSNNAEKLCLGRGAGSRNLDFEFSDICVQVEPMFVSSRLE